MMNDIDGKFVQTYCEFLHGFFKTDQNRIIIDQLGDEYESTEEEAHRSSKLDPLWTGIV